jgi:hypothetical protein
MKNHPGWGRGVEVNLPNTKAQLKEVGKVLMYEETKSA